MGTAGRECSVHAGKGQEMAIEVLGRVGNFAFTCFMVFLCGLVGDMIVVEHAGFSVFDWVLITLISVGLVGWTLNSFWGMGTWLWYRGVQPGFEPEDEL